MASFPDLRPDHRLALAERRAVHAFRRFALLPAPFQAPLSVVAFLADSELATLRGAKAPVRTPAFLTHAVREPAPGTGGSIGALA